MNIQLILSQHCSAGKCALHQTLQHTAARLRKGIAIDFLEVGFKPKFCKGLRRSATICEAVRNVSQSSMQDSDLVLRLYARKIHCVWLKL
ncbi:MAG: hypothetical protein A2Y12_03700 [Planctomycetes bacterium GWF2_42_9]|nr:MAG: hypothetical protein A2Y12_03700 [Planctomycetes bacterium GWF2_42_9]